MNLITLTRKNLQDRPLSTLLSLLLIMLAVGLISFVSQFNKSVKNQLDNNVRGIDMVVGAKGSPLQLILSAVLQIDAPTGNIDFGEAKKLRRHRLVKSGVPLSYGDTYKGFRIIGTDSNYLKIYKIKLAEGTRWEKPFEVGLGANVAKRLNLKIGDQFFGSHGLVEGGGSHEAHHYIVKGIYEISNTVVDQLILTRTESVWEVHHHEGEVQQDEQQITAMLIKFRSPMGVIQLPRWVNGETNMQAAIPSYELIRLYGLLGFGFNTLNLLSIVIMVVAGLSVFISLYSSLKSRQFEMALMRSYGASRRKLAFLIILEGLFISILGYLFGILLSRVGFLMINKYVATDFNVQLKGLIISLEEAYLFATIIVIALVAAIIPVYQVIRINISKILADH